MAMRRMKDLRRADARLNRTKRYILKINFFISCCLLSLTCVAVPGWSQPELVYVENGMEREIDGIDGATPYYYMDFGEKKLLGEMSGCFLRTNDADILSAGYAPVSYIVENCEADAMFAVVSIGEKSRDSSWNRFKVNSLLKLWDEEVIKNAAFLLCWYQPGAELLTIGKLVKLPYYEGKLFRTSLRVEVDNEEKDGGPVLLLWGKDGPIPPKSSNVENEDFFRLIISGSLEQIEENEISENLLKSKDAFGNGAVHYAAAHGRTDILEKLILEGAELNAGNENKMTPLLLAVSAGHKSTLDLLLHYKADTKKKDTDDRTALHYASYCGHEDIVRELLNNNKRSVNKKDAFHQTPVHYAINASNDDIVGLLADNKGNIRSDKENLQGLLINHISGENFNIVNFLLDHNAKANGEIYGTTPLIIAAGNSSLEMVDLLLEQGASVNRSNENQISPLLSACLTGRLEVVNYLLEKDANVNVQSKSGLSAIQAAVLRNDPEMIDLLISHGVDIETEDGAGRTPFWNAAILGYRESMKTLLEAGASCNLNMKDAIGLMELAFRYDMPEAVGLALDQCLDANFLFYDKYPSTWMAEYYAADEILDLLIASGAEKNTGEALAIIPIKDLSERPRIVEHTGIYYPTDQKVSNLLKPLQGLADGHPK
jgi:ankyrin repeat protein